VRVAHQRDDVVSVRRRRHARERLDRAPERRRGFGTPAAGGERPRRGRALSGHDPPARVPVPPRGDARRVEARQRGPLDLAAHVQVHDAEAAVAVQAADLRRRRAREQRRARPRHAEDARRQPARQRHRLARTVVVNVALQHRRRVAVVSDLPQLVTVAERDRDAAARRHVEQRAHPCAGPGRVVAQRRERDRVEREQRARAAREHGRVRAAADRERGRREADRRARARRELRQL